jgi:hypothetical protein
LARITRLMIFQDHGEHTHCPSAMPYEATKNSQKPALISSCGTNTSTSSINREIASRN